MGWFDSQCGVRVLAQIGPSDHQALKMDGLGPAWPRHLCHGTAQIIRTKVQKQSPEQLNSRT
jgi:hypothetical protein